MRAQMWLNEKTERRLQASFIADQVIKRHCELRPCAMPLLFAGDGEGARAVCTRCGKRMRKSCTVWEDC